jgi:hypothetical protein
MMTFFAERGDYGPTDDPAGKARELSDRFGSGEITSLDRTLPTGARARHRASLDDRRSLVTYRELDGP